MNHQIALTTHIPHLAELFSVLGDTTRLRILFLLRGSEQPVQSLSENLAITPSAVSHQLRLLRSLHLVKCRRDGRNMLYSLCDKCVWDLLHAGESHLSHETNEYPVETTSAEEEI